MNREELLKIAKPILFNTEMVRAILEGRKTVTRRVIKRDISNQFDCEADGTAIAYIDQATGDSYKPWEVCRFKKGDYLYVRETWHVCKGKYIYKAGFNKGLDALPLVKWRPSIHMPKKAARIFLIVTRVSVERLQMMNGKDVLKEGVDNGSSNPTMGYRFDVMQRTAFKDLWNSTVKKADLDKYGWDANPWVWIIEFERVEV